MSRWCLWNARGRGPRRLQAVVCEPDSKGVLRGTPAMLSTISQPPHSMSAVHPRWPRRSASWLIFDVTSAGKGSVILLSLR